MHFIHHAQKIVLGINRLKDLSLLNDLGLKLFSIELIKCHNQDKIVI